MFITFTSRIVYKTDLMIRVPKLTWIPIHIPVHLQVWKCMSAREYISLSYAECVYDYNERKFVRIRNVLQLPIFQIQRLWNIWHDNTSCKHHSVPSNTLADPVGQEYNSTLQKKLKIFCENPPMLFIVIHERINKVTITLKMGVTWSTHYSIIHQSSLL